MALKQRYGNWYCDFVAPIGKGIRRCLGTQDKKQAQELYDKLRADAWRVERLGELAEHTFDEACLRWLNEKELKRSLDDDRTKIEFFLGQFQGQALSSITEDKIIAATSGMINRRHRRVWERHRDAAVRKGTPKPEYKENLISAATRSQYLSFIRSLEWKWLRQAPLIKTRKPMSKRIRWLTWEEASRLT